MRAEPFLDNWAYLKVELNWLERLLLTAVARQRKDTKTVERVSQTKADRATSHWWKGLVSFDEIIASDSPAERRKPTPPASYQQQLDARIQASWHKGIGLALPMLCDRLELNAFEKNAILLALAPEIHRRYAQMYGYLQTGQDIQERPSIDLVLRLFCRTDVEWRIARSSLLDSSRLLQSGLMQVEGAERSLFLTRSLKLSDECVNYLLSDPADFAELEALLDPQTSTVFARSVPRTPIDLVLPELVLEQLNQICEQVKFAPQLKAWGFQQFPGINALLIGAHGTGKTLSVQWIAQQLEMPLTEVDLAIVEDSLIADLIAERPMLLLIKSAERWLNRSAPIAKVLELINSRRTLTCFSVGHRIAVPNVLRSRFQFTIEFPKPDQSARLKLWRQAFPAETPIAELDWHTLAKKHNLTGGEIKAIAKAAAIEALAQEACTIELDHILKALSVR
ncbi:MAG: hypothetical protein MUC48_00325 [Leptolyngbya sp. Prado105]|jgi:hypothetical protein|nr:hypothetical protein [Leptolyngbya sp. Prado105]